jgi:hypothetical protein
MRLRERTISQEGEGEQENRRRHYRDQQAVASNRSTSSQSIPEAMMTGSYG